MPMSASALRRMKNKVIPFKFAPFSAKQKKVMAWWANGSPYKNYNAIICDGAVRSGKTVSMALSYVQWAMESFNGMNFGMCGKTIHAHRRNVIKPLKQMLKSRRYEVLDIVNENVLIIQKKYKDKEGKAKTSINYFYIFGGGDESSQDTIQGITLAGCLFDEVALMPESFVQQATARCSVTGAKFWFSCNPDNPFHWFKKEWIEKTQIKKVLYLHFTMDDNPSLSEEVKERYKSLYTGIFYKRFILGLWVMADGVVYPMFDQDLNCINYQKIWTRNLVAIDFGIQNPTTFGMYGYYGPEKHYHLIDYYYHNGREEGQKTVKEYVDDLIEFIDKCQLKPEYIAIDPSASAMIVEIRKRSYFKRRGIRIIPAKNNVMNGIQVVSYLLQERRFTLAPHCIKDQEEFAAYVWDEKAAEKGADEVVKTNDHCMDRNRYAIYTDAIMFKTLENITQVVNSGRGALE